MHSENLEEKRYTILEALEKLAPSIKMVIPLDISVTVTDTEKILVSYSAEAAKEATKNTSPYSLRGKPLQKASGPYRSIKFGELQETIYPKEVYGVPFKSYAVPIQNEAGSIIGSLAVGVSLQYQEMLMASVETLAATCEEVIASTEELAASAQLLTEGITNVNHLSAEMSEEVNKTELLLAFIRKLASSSNLLGLNATIEAARAGKEGLGFQIVASEIRKMAEDSAKTVIEIKTILEKVVKKVARISDEIPKALLHSQQQALASKEIADAIISLNTYITGIEDIAKKF